MSIDNHHRHVVSTLATGAVALLTACGVNTSAASPVEVGGNDSVVSVDVYCVVRQLPEAGASNQAFEEVCLYEGAHSGVFPKGVVRERIVDDDRFVSGGSDGSVRTGSCLGGYVVDYPRASERDAGVLPHTIGALQGHELCTFTGSFVGVGERDGQQLLEEGWMYRASDTSYRGRVEMRPAS